MCQLEHGPEAVTMEMVGLRIGNVAMVGFPGEPFTDIGVRIKACGGFDLVMPCALTNGAYGYFPMQSAYDEGRIRGAFLALSLRCGRKNRGMRR